MPENLKNILLVMASGGFLVRPGSADEKADGSSRQLWDQTWKRLERFLPDLKDELFPPVPEPAPEKAEADVTVVECAPENLTPASTPSPSPESSS